MQSVKSAIMKKKFSLPTADKLGKSYLPVSEELDPSLSPHFHSIFASKKYG